MLIRTFIAAAALATPAFAQFQPVDAEDIVVVAQPLREQVRNFVADAAQDMASEDQMARWERRVCPMIVGLRERAQAQFIADRIAQRAYALGIKSEGPGCRPTVLIFVTPDAGALAGELAAEYRQLVGYHSNATAVTMGHEALTDFVETPRPVRWWHVSQTVTQDGDVLGESMATPAGDGLRNAQVVQVRNAGRLVRSTRQDLSRVLIVVDADDAAGVRLAALGDYLAMVSLAQIAADAEASAAPSILRLFAGPGAPTEMTEWDLAYLEGLYAARRTAPNAQTQRRDIVRRMEDALGD